MKVIGALVTALAQGRGGVLVIEGPPGIGKSRLLTEVMALADKGGVRTLFGEAFEYQQTVPFFSLFMATLRADPPVGDADALRRLGGSADLRYWVVHDLADAIYAAAAQTPLAIVLEDIHWADNSTLVALRSLATARPPLTLSRPSSPRPPTSSRTRNGFPCALAARFSSDSSALARTTSQTISATAPADIAATRTPAAPARCSTDNVSCTPGPPAPVRAVKTHSTATPGCAVASDRSANSVLLSAQWMSSSTIASGVCAAAA